MIVFSLNPQVECREKQVPVDIGAVSRRYWDVSERTLYATRLQMGNQCRDRRTVSMLQRIRSGHNTRSSILGPLKINVNHCSSPGLTYGSAPARDRHRCNMGLGMETMERGYTV